MNTSNPPEVPFDTVLDEILQSYRRGIYDAQNNQVTDGGIDTDQSKQNLIAALQALVTAQKPEKRILPSEHPAGIPMKNKSEDFCIGFNVSADLFETNLLKALKGGSE